MQSLNETATPQAMTEPLAKPQTQALLLSQNKSPTCKQQEKKNQEWQNKQMKLHTQHLHTPRQTRRQQRQKHTRWNSVSTKTRQACNRNQTNSNDFPALLPYKGIGTPSKSSADHCSCLSFFQAQIPFGVCLVGCRLLWEIYFHAGRVCCCVCLVRKVPSALAWSPAVLQSAVRAEGGSTEAEDNPIRAQGRQRK